MTIGYPLLMGMAMRYAPASHGGVVLAVQPLITALASMRVAGERPSPAFWACSLAGTAAAVDLRRAVERGRTGAALGRSVAGGRGGGRLATATRSADI